MIKELAKTNGFYDDVRTNLEFRLEKDDNDKWCITKGHYSGRDFYDYIPIEFLNAEEVEKLKLDIIEDVAADIPEDNFIELFKDTYNNIEAQEELTKKGYSCSNEKDVFFEILREYVENEIFDDLFEQFCNSNTE